MQTKQTLFVLENKNPLQIQGYHSGGCEEFCHVGIVPYRPAKVNRRFRGTSLLHHQDLRVS
jgi:hypothetical protein